jgi:hypothetical protein
MLEDDDIMAKQQLLFALHVHKKIRIFFVEIVDGYILQVLHRSDEPAVDSGFLQSRMSKLDQNSVSHGDRSVR